MPLRSKIVAFGCTLALAASIGVVLFVNFQPDPGLIHRSLDVVVALWIAVFFVPPFLAGFRAKKRGALYGLIIGIVPVVIAVLVGYNGPAIVAVAFYALAPMGGFLGQHISPRRRAG